MNQQKNNSKNKPFGVIDAIRYMMFTAMGLFMSGAGFGGCVVCSVAQGCSWNIVFPCLAMVLIGAIVVMLSVINMVDAIGSSNGGV
jgi:hypothetical protein